MIEGICVFAVTEEFRDDCDRNLFLRRPSRKQSSVGMIDAEQEFVRYSKGTDASGETREDAGGDFDVGELGAEAMVRQNEVNAVNVDSSAKWIREETER